VLDLAVSSGVPAVRVTRSASRGPTGRVVRRFARRLEHDAQADGLAFPVDAAGLDEAGALDEPTAIAALERLAAAGAPTVELSSHPGAHEDRDRARYEWNYRWGDELDALCSPEVRATVDRLGFRLGTYGDLVSQIGAR
jgi:hypothetical protein